MEFKINDKVAITQRDGKGSNGVITKVSDQDPIFKYEVTTQDGKVYWKSSSGLLPFIGSIVTVAPKKRGRKPGVKNKKKQVKISVASEKQNVSKSFADKYSDFISTLTLKEFLELHEVVNRDFVDAASLLRGCLGLKQNDE